jgi:hypothetical protein
LTQVSSEKMATEEEVDENYHYLPKLFAAEPQSDQFS